jgi:hypothetical protein
MDKVDEQQIRREQKTAALEDANKGQTMIESATRGRDLLFSPGGGVKARDAFIGFDFCGRGDRRRARTTLHL